MSFYPAYLTYLNNAHQLLKTKGWSSKALDWLLDDLSFEDKPLDIGDLWLILEDLHLIDNLLDKGGLTNAIKETKARLVGDLTYHLLEESNKHSLHFDHTTYRLWLNKNFAIGSVLIKAMGHSKWLSQLRNREPAVADYKSQFNLLHIILSQTIRLGILPSKSWYLANDDLKNYPTSESFIELGFNDLAAFQTLDELYPGFLTQVVTSYEELNTFCQLLPKTFGYLLTSEKVKPLLTSSVNAIRILERIATLHKDDKCQIALSFIHDLDDLIDVTNAFPSYCFLIADRKDRGGPRILYHEGPCMALVQTRQDLLRFDLTLPGMQMIILHVPRLRVLLGTSPGLLFDSVRSMVEQQKLLEIPRRDSARYGLIPELVPQPYSGISGEILDKRLLTLGQAIYRSQFLEGGYYEEGHVQFEGDQGEGHFITEASKGHTLAIALANRAFETWKQMLPQEGPFYVLECGAGDGDLCYKILRFVHFMARKNSQWRQFEEKIHYTILELSSALVKRQKHTLCNLIATNKVEVIQGNALSMDKFIKKKVHLQLSNELADMFASEQIVINKEGECEVSMVVPVLTYAAYAFLSEHHADCVAILIDEAKKYKLLLDYHSINILNRGYVLTAQRFQKLVAITANKNFKGPGECFRYDHTSLPLSFFPEIEDYLAEHPEIFAGMRVNDTKIVCPQLDTYARQLVRNSAVSIVVDYGGLSIDLRNSSYRTFGSTDLCYRHFPLFKVGALDVTYDVDFSALVSALKRLAPQGRANLICMIGLLPAKLELPGVYQGLCDFSTDCREFLAAIYVSGEVNVHFPDTNASKVPFVNPHQFFQAATSVAREIIRINLSGVAHNGDNNQRVI